MIVKYDLRILWEEAAVAWFLKLFQSFLEALGEKTINVQRPFRGRILDLLNMNQEFSPVSPDLENIKTKNKDKTTGVLSLKYNQQDATFSRSIFFYKLLHMFQAVPPPIMRSTKLYIQREALSNQYCCLLLPWMGWNGVPSHPR